MNAPFSLEKYAHLPLAFENQDTGNGTYVARGEGYMVELHNAKATIAVLSGKGETAHPFFIEFAGSRPSQAVPGAELPGKVNYIQGNDPKKWKLGLSTHASIRYQSVYPGIDVVYYGNQQQLEFDLVVRPGADPGLIRMKVAGGKLSTDSAGSLLVEEVAGITLRIELPQIYQETAGVRRNIAGRYLIHGDEVAFQVPSFDRSKELVIDPTISYSTFFGGSSADGANAIAVDSSGNVLIAGYAVGANYPIANAFQSAPEGISDTGYVTKINAAGTALIYSTYLGGSTADHIQGIAVDAAGAAWVTGDTASPDFPQMNSFQSTFGGGSDAFLAKLDVSGGLQFSTFIGGNGMEMATGVAVDNSGNAYVTGTTLGGAFPVSFGVMNSQAQGGNDAFVVKFGTAGTRVFSALLGGSGSDYAYAITVDSAGCAYITGSTYSPFFVGAPAGGRNQRMEVAVTGSWPN